MIIDVYRECTISEQDLKKCYVNILIEGKYQISEVDSGAGFTLLPETDYQRLHLSAKLQPTSVKFRTYTSQVFKPLGIVEVPVRYNNTESTEVMFIVPSQFSPLLGRAWIRHLRVNLAELDEKKDDLTISSVSAIDPVPDIIKTFSDIFEPKVGCIPNLTCSLKLRAKAKPVFLKEREVPYALREKVEKELAELERDGL